MKKILVTGGSGYLGSHTVETLAQQKEYQIISLDINPPRQRMASVHYESGDVRHAEPIHALFAKHHPEVVIHLASIVSPAKKSRRDFEYDVDVNGSRHVLEACVAHGVRRIIVSSSGAAYGYYADNPQWLVETAPLRGNQSFAYADHKRQVEEMLADYRVQHPQLQQVVFRIGTILGARVKNQITDLFEKPRLIAVRGSDSPFVFIHDTDVVGAIRHAVESAQTGVFNVAGDGKLTLFEIAQKLNKPCIVLPASVLRMALWLLKKFNLTQYGPEQLDFLRYRPVLLNTKLKEVFGYTPKHTSAEVFEIYRQSRLVKKT